MESSPMLKRLKEHLESEEGLESLRLYFEKINKIREMEESQVDRFVSRYPNSIDEIVQKVLDKYDTDEYVNKWYSLGFEPPEPLLFFLYSVAEKYGEEVTENSPESWKECANMFTGGLYHYKGWVFNKMYGQGCVVKVSKV